MTRRAKPVTKRDKTELMTQIKEIEKEAQKNIPVSVTIIVRNNYDHLSRCLESVNQVLIRPGDQIIVLDTGSDDPQRIATICEKNGADYAYEKHVKDIGPLVEKWLPEFLEVYKESSLVKGTLLSFAAARTACQKYAKHPVQFWIDSDDTIVEEETGKLRWLVNELFGEKGLNGKKADALFMEYKYAFDQSDGSLITTLKRERVVDTRFYHWVGRCHETLIPKPGAINDIHGAGMFDDLGTHIYHHKEREDARVTDIRNYIIMRNEIEEAIKDGKQPDPRTIMYLGNACRGLSRHVEAIQHYEELIARSGSREDRFLASYYIAMVYLSDQYRRPLDAMETLWRCIKIKPEDPRPWYAISRCYYALGRYREALQYFYFGRVLPMPKDNLHAEDPQHNTLLPYQIAAVSCLEVERYPEAQEYVEVMQRSYPNHDLTKAVKQAVDSKMAEISLVDSIMRLTANELPNGADNKTARKHVARHIELLPSIPPTLESRGFSATEKPPFEPEISIFCGESCEPFGPATTGLGGSEKMVVMMAEALGKAGRKVAVYCKCPHDQRGLHKETGVWWWHWAGMDDNINRKVLIMWRSPEMLEMPVPAEKRILWCHDVQDEWRWTDARVALADQVWVQSEYHATTLGKWRDKLGDKVKILRNAIDSTMYQDAWVSPPKRNNKKIVFLSSPDRGILTACKIFQQAKQEYPEYMEGAELHLFYGFTKLFLDHNARFEYRHIPDMEKEMCSWDYMRMVHLMVDNSPDIHWRGRVSWKEMVHELMTAGVWLYPTRFPEISCMAAMESQAAGVRCVTTDYAALAETVDWKDKLNLRLDLSDWLQCTQQLVQAINPGVIGDDDRQKTAEAAIKRFDNRFLASAWLKLIDE